MKRSEERRNSHPSFLLHVTLLLCFTFAVGHIADLHAIRERGVVRKRTRQRPHVLYHHADVGVLGVIGLAGQTVVQQSAHGYAGLGRNLVDYVCGEED